MISRDCCSFCASTSESSLGRAAAACCSAAATSSWAAVAPFWPSGALSGGFGGVDACASGRVLCSVRRRSVEGYRRPWMTRAGGLPVDARSAHRRRAMRTTRPNGTVRVTRGVGMAKFRMHSRRPSSCFQQCLSTASKGPGPRKHLWRPSLPDSAPTQLNFDDWSAVCVSTRATLSRLGRMLLARPRRPDCRHDARQPGRQNSLCRCNQSHTSLTHGAVVSLDHLATAPVRPGALRRLQCSCSVRMYRVCLQREHVMGP